MVASIKIRQESLSPVFNIEIYFYSAKIKRIVIISLFSAKKQAKSPIHRHGDPQKLGFWNRYCEELEMLITCCSN